MRDSLPEAEMHSNAVDGHVLVLASKAAFRHRFNPDNKQWTSPASRNRSNAATIETRESWNKTFPQQVFSLAARSRFVPMREKEHAPELHSAQKRQVAATRDRNSNGKTLAPCGSRIWPGCFLVPKVCSRSGISMVRVARRLPLLLLQNTGAMSVDSIGHRRLCFESAFAFPEQAARLIY